MPPTGQIVTAAETQPTPSATARTAPTMTPTTTVGNRHRVADGCFHGNGNRRADCNDGADEYARRRHRRRCPTARWYTSATPCTWWTWRLRRRNGRKGCRARPSMDADRGMLFVYDEDGARSFWMPDMHFPLDMVWIRADCIVAGVTADVPNPPLDTPRDQLEHYPSAGMVRFILELNAGQAATQGIEAGGPVEFGGEIAGKWGC